MAVYVKPNYIYNARVVEVHDGDTVLLDVDLGFFTWVLMPCRLLGINAPELNTPKGRAARDFLKGLLPVDTWVTVQSTKPDKYGGRFDGLIHTVNGVDVSSAMIVAGHAAPWGGQGVKPVP